jgi:hypothetical protein
MIQFVTLMVLLIGSDQVTNKIDSDNDLYNIYKIIQKESQILQKRDNLTNNELNIFKKYFFDNQNLYFHNIDNKDLGNCGVFNLKPRCYQAEYGYEQEIIDDETACLSIYGIHHQKPEKLIIQDTTLFTKKNGKWVVVGNRKAVQELQSFTYSTFQGKQPKEMFTNLCYSKEKLKLWREKIESLNLEKNEIIFVK